MMLDIDFAELRAGFVEYLPFGALIAILLVTAIVLGVGAWKAGGIELGHRLATLAANKPNVQAIGDLLYTRNIFLFEPAGPILLVFSSDERRVGKKCVRTCNTQWT